MQNPVKDNSVLSVISLLIGPIAMYTDYPVLKKFKCLDRYMKAWGGGLQSDVGWGTPEEHFTEEVIMTLNPMQ